MISQYRGLRREVYVLSFGRLVTGLGSMVWPMMTLILNQKMNVGAGRISWLLSVALLLMAPAVYLGGRIADIANKKHTIVALDIISVITFGICAFIPMGWGAVFMLFIGSVCQNMEHPAYMALMADITLTADRDRAYSLQYMCANLGLVLAPTLAGILFRNYLWLVFLINSLSVLSSTLLIVFLMKDIEPYVENTAQAVYQKSRTGESVLEVLSRSKAVLMYIAVMSGYYSIYQMYTYLMPIDLAVLHGDSGALIYGSVTSINCIVVVIFTPVITGLFGKRSEPDRITAGVTLMVLGFMTFVLFKGVIPSYYISMTVLTWGEVFALTSESAYISRRVPASHRGQVNGAGVVARTALTIILQLAAGALYESKGSAAAWIMVLGAGVLFIIIAFCARSADRKEFPALYCDADNILITEK